MPNVVDSFGQKIPSTLAAGPLSSASLFSLEGLLAECESVMLDNVNAQTVLAYYDASILYGVTPFDPLVIAGVVALLAVVGVLAAFVPARRATRVDPAVVLRGE